ncbi:hypothetical protein [Mesonia sp. K7]|uniref:hypothetical protein n=1 Tax=Mesonia sp. K7 TaxID=2218606 RepID=UPI000DAAAD50|nr:hypothetical protein [Mesonia sp. K7]PZD79132.1 hypothetical protein DNG35_03745 [Mesonia sp. K7]
MSNYQAIQDKLEQFIKKYYTNKLIKGGILFLAIGLLYFLFTVFFEQVFWLSPMGRTILFWLFIGVEIFLFLRFIAIPLSKLLKLAGGISHEEASKMIGNHFPEVDDKLLNILQLQQQPNAHQTDLLLASIEQKSQELQPVPFTSAINYKKSLGYAKYAVIPLGIILAIYISGHEKLFSESYHRVVNYKKQFVPPAPFQFRVLPNKLQVYKNQDLNVSIETYGDIAPENANIIIDGQASILKSDGIGKFNYTFSKITENTSFRIISNGVESQEYTIEVVDVPELTDFKMQLFYPKHVNQASEIVSGTGNATIPEGTTIKWILNTVATENVDLVMPDSTYIFEKSNQVFDIQKSIYSSVDYAVITSNQAVKNHETLNYSLKVIKDQYPKIEVEKRVDTTNNSFHYFKGIISDDYAISRLEIVYYPTNNQNDIKTAKIDYDGKDYAAFFYQFPNNLELEKGQPYAFYFRVSDNDALHKYKSTNSEVFNYQLLTKQEELEQNLENQSEAIDGISKTIEQMKSSSQDLKEFSKTQLEKENLNYQDRQKLQNFLEREKQQNEMMKNFSEKLKENLDKLEENNELKEQLEEKLENSKEKLEQDNKLLEELEKYQDKLNKEQLHKKIEELQKNSSFQEKTLEQLVELTKRFYVEEKAKKIASEMDKLAEEQQKLSDKKEENTSEAQKEVSEKFEELKKELDELQKENEGLKQPMDLPRDEQGEKEVSKEQQKAEENLEQSEQQKSSSQQQSSKQKASQNQKSAAKKMQQMANQMQQMIAQNMESQMQEDAEMLKQILENLLVFSFEQEDLMLKFEKTSTNSQNYASQLRRQQSLKENFKHIDDSLFVLASRNPMLEEEITEKLVDVDYNINQALERFAENMQRQGIASQQYVFKGANDLANMLDQTLSNMQQMMQMQGQGQGQPKPGQGQGQGGFQLQDIIMSQEQLSKKAGEKAKQQGKNGQPQNEGGEKEGENGTPKKTSEDGKKQSKGEKGKQPGQEGQNGQRGGDGDGEQWSKELYEIFKEQQTLRFQLEDIIKAKGLQQDAGNLLKSLEKIEDDLLNKGITRETEKQMLNVKHRLLQLENAAFQKEQDSKRTSKTNDKEFNHQNNVLNIKAKEYFNSDEILNRQTLPLQKNYKELVKEYFTKD